MRIKAALLLFAALVAWSPASWAEEEQDTLGLMMNGRYILVPASVMSVFVKTPRPVSATAMGLGVVYRYAGGSQLMVRLNHMWIMVDDGVWLGATHDWDEAEYIRYKDPGYTWLDFYFGSSIPLPADLSFIYGGSIGLGLVHGDMYGTDMAGCNEDNYDDPGQHGCFEIPGSEEAKDVPRWIPSVSVELGMRYTLFQNLSVEGNVGLFLPGFLSVSIGMAGTF